MTNIANTDQYDAWNGDSGQRWIQDPDRRDQVLAPIADALLDAAALTAGEHVLDIGCGCGATTFAATHTIGANGTVTGIDLSDPMLDVARRRAAAAGHDNVSFVQGDAQTHDLGTGLFDVAISRFGTMFFADPVAAFTNTAAALVPGGRMCLATWQPLVANPWLTVPGAALLRYGTLPDTADDAGPGMFAQSEPDVVRQVLADAGYEDISLHPVDVTLTLGAEPDEAAEYLADSGPGRAVLATIPDPDKPAALNAVRATLADHTDHAGVHLDAGIWIITAIRS
ncbi:MAG TPA: methyltransferase domain-containing protein [Acidimicrobiales bacterium]|jgi:ubiquinone/menaquinone biosynthesis C-methylase UbiE|nr:methyltransferase domain-containing protein [Acidimicrobiales bacterium]